MKILLDMNLSSAWVDYLAPHGIVATHWSQIGRPADPDRTIMDYAAQHGFVVMTNDLDFGSMLASLGSQAPSVIQIRAKDLRPGMIGEDVARALLQAEQELSMGALLTIDLRRVRLRLLPLMRP